MMNDESSHIIVIISDIVMINYDFHGYSIMLTAALAHHNGSSEMHSVDDYIEELYEDWEMNLPTRGPLCHCHSRFQCR